MREFWLFVLVGMAVVLTIIWPPHPPRPSAVLIVPENVETSKLSNLKVGDEVAFTVDKQSLKQAFYPEIQIKEYQWALERSFLSAPMQLSSKVEKEGKGEKFTHKFKYPGKYILRVKVTNTVGVSKEGKLEMTVYPAEKCEIRDLNVEPHEDYPPLKAVVSFIPFHPQFDEKEIINYEINWGDSTSGESGYTLNGKKVSREHEYDKPGQYAITVTVWIPWIEEEKYMYMETTEVSENINVSVLHHKHYMMPAWSPDGDRIAVIYRDDSAPNTYKLLYFDNIREALKGKGKPQENVVWTENVEILFPYWMNEKIIVFSANVTGISYDLYQLDTVTGAKYPLMTTDYRDELYPTYKETEGGEKFILFSGAVPAYSRHKNVKNLPSILGTDAWVGSERLRKGIPQYNYEEVQIYKYSFNIGETQLTLSKYKAEYPVPWKEGRFLFVRRGQLMSSSLDGIEKNIRNETVRGEAHVPVYLRPNPVAPDYIAYVAQEGKAWKVFIRVPGGGYIPLVKETKETSRLGYPYNSQLYPSWSPDGKYLVAQVWSKAGWTIRIWQVMEEKDGTLKILPEPRPIPVQLRI